MNIHGKYTSKIIEHDGHDFNKIYVPYLFRQNDEKIPSFIKFVVTLLIKKSLIHVESTFGQTKTTESDCPEVSGRGLPLTRQC